MTLKNEEPSITTVSIRPGVVDTAMQVDIREKYLQSMDEKDQGKFVSAKKDGKLLKPELPGRVIAELAVRAATDLSGLFLRYVFRLACLVMLMISSWDDLKLADYQVIEPGS